MTDLSELDIPERTLKLLVEWTIEGLAGAKPSKLTKIKGIGLKTAKFVIKTARQQMKKDQEAKWRDERQQLREEIETDEYFFASRQAGLVMQQELASKSVRIRRIERANASNV